MNIYKIYKITNLVNGKVYIGQTKNELKVRLSGHFNYAINKQGSNDLSRDILAFGKENFKIEQIDSSTSISESDTLEQKYISKYDSINKGYNMTNGGRNCKMPIHSIKRSSDAKKKSVIQYSLKGEFIARYNSIKDASEKTNISRGNISSVCTGARNTCGGFQFRYENNFRNISATLIRKPSMKSVIMLKKTGEKIKQYNSIKEASIMNKISASSISEVINKKRKTAGGYKWKVTN